MGEAKEEIIWQGQPSQIDNLGLYILCFFGCWLIAPVFFAIWKWLETRTVEYEMTNHRIFVRSGIFTKNIEEIELYRVKDYSVQQPFFLRIFFLYNVTMNTSDNTLPVLVFKSIPHGDEVRDKIRFYVETLRTEKNIREVDFNS